MRDLAIGTDQPFETDEWEKLSTDDRIRACHSMARKARRFADSADPECKRAYVHLAEQWDALASELALVG